MMKKILILGLIICSLLVVSMNSVVAEEPVTITDDEGDVMDDYFEFVDSSNNIDIDNIDITNVIYTRDGKSVTLTLTVKGLIEDRGHIDDLESEFDKDIDVISYSFDLYTSDNDYLVNYVNNDCYLYYSYDEKDIISASVVGDTITVTFDLNSTGKTCESIMAMTMYTKMPDLSDVDPDDYDDYLDLIEQLFDEASYEYDDDDDDNDGESNDGTDGTSGDTDKDDSSDSGLLLFVAVITMIVIIGVAVIVYIIRR